MKVKRILSFIIFFFLFCSFNLVFSAKQSIKSYAILYNTKDNDEKNLKDFLDKDGKIKFDKKNLDELYKDEKNYIDDVATYIYFKELLKNSKLDEKVYKVFLNQVLYQIFSRFCYKNMLNGMLFFHFIQSNDEYKDEVEKINKALKVDLRKKLKKIDLKDFEKAKLEIINYIKSLIHVNNLYLKERKKYKNSSKKDGKKTLEIKQYVKYLKEDLKHIKNVEKENLGYLKFLGDIKKVDFVENDVRS